MKAEIDREDHKSVAHYNIETSNRWSHQVLFDTYAVEIPDDLIARHKAAQKELRECEILVSPYYYEAVDKHTRFPVNDLVKALLLEKKQ
jgi:hypothetical protein